MLFQKAQKKLNGNQNKIDRKNKERTRSLNRWYLSSPIGRILLTLSEKVSLCTSCAKIEKGRTVSRDSTCTSAVFSGYGDNDFLYGHLQSADDTFAGVV